MAGDFGDNTIIFDCSTLIEADTFVRQYEVDHCVKFPIKTTDKTFKSVGDTDNTHISQRCVYFDGYAARVIGHRNHYCAHGKDYHQKQKVKERELAERQQGEDHAQGKRRRFLTQPTIKIGCPAKLIVTRYARYPQHQVDSNASKWKKDEVARKLKDALSLSNKPFAEERYRVRVFTNHTGHAVGQAASMSQAIDRSIVKRIHELVDKGVTSVNAIKRFLKDFVENTLFTGDQKPEFMNTRFYPATQDIANHIQIALRSKLYSANDQENLRMIIAQEWAGIADSIFFRPSGDQSFVFVHQTPNQKRLLSLYGNELSLLDATYKTTKYQLHLFFVTVKTNVDYQVAASFILETEKSEDIQLALSKIQEWNTDWHPSHWMTDCAATEIAAIEAIFPATKVFVCGFHMEQAWDRKLTEKEVGVSLWEKDAVKSHLRAIAFALTEEERTEKVEGLVSSDIWTKHPKLRDYLSSQWLSDTMHKRWAICYRQERTLRGTNTNNGTENMNKVFKRAFLNNKGKTLSRTVNILVTDFSPELYKRYCLANYRSSKEHKPYSADLHEFLHNRPKRMVERCKGLIESSMTIASSKMLDMGNLTYIVHGSVDSYNVNMNTPSCTCRDFCTSDYMCKHIFAIMQKFGCALPSHYSDLPWFNLDSCLVDTIDTPRRVSKDDITVDDLACRNNTDADHAFDAIVDPPVDRETPPMLPIAPRIHRLNAATAREILKEIHTLTFLTSEASNRSIIPQLNDILSVLRSNAPAEDGLIRRPRVAADRRQPKLRCYSRKSRWSGRVGKKAERNRPTHLNINSMSKGNSNIPNQSPPSVKHVSNTSTCSSSKVAVAAQYGHICSASVCLSDEDINAALKIMQSQWPDIKMQDCLLVQRPFGFDSVKDGYYAQVVHDVERFHWVACTNYSSMTATKTTRVFDNLSLRPSSSTLKGIASLEKTQLPELVLKFEAVQQQEGGSDCGIFAIANLVECLSDGNPARVIFDQSKIRDHLVRCLNAGHFTVFPRQLSGISVRRVRTRRQVLKVYCICRLPYVSGQEMLECDKCGEWYHRECVTVPANAFASRTTCVEYACDKCIHV